MRFLLLSLSFLTLSLAAQPFKPDRDGYVDDSSFQKLIKKRVYRLVGTYMQISGIQGKGALVLGKDKKWKVIDLNGKEFPAPPQIFPEPMIVEAIPEEVTVDQATNFLGFGLSAEAPSADTFEIAKGENGKMGTRNRFSGEQGLDFIYDNIFLSRGRIVLLKKDQLYGLAKLSGDILLPVAYEDVAFLATGYVVKKNGKYGFFNTQNPVTPVLKYDNIRDLSRGAVRNHVYVYEAGIKKGLLDHTGEEKTPALYDEVSWYNHSLLLVAINDPNEKRYALISSNLKTIPDAEFSSVSDIGYNLIKVKKGEAAGYYDAEGNMLLECRYGHTLVHDDVIEFHDNSEGWGLYNRKLKKKFLIGTYDYMGRIRYTDLFTVQKGGLHGVVDTGGRFLLPVKYTSIEGDQPFSRGFARVKIGSRSFLADRYGNECEACKEPY